jgi:hypothetical protein
MDEERISALIHDFTGHGQMFHSYAQLVSNPSLRVSPKKMQEILIKCSKHCLEIRNILLEEVKV